MGAVLAIASVHATIASEGARAYLNRLPDTEVLFFLPDARLPWTMVHRRGGS